MHYSEEVIDVHAGDQHIIRYKPIAALVSSGDAVLIWFVIKTVFILWKITSDFNCYAVTNATRIFLLFSFYLLVTFNIVLVGS